MSAFQRRRLHWERLEDRRLLAVFGTSDVVFDDADVFGEPQARSAAVRGVVWNDLNGNGRRENDEPGLSGVTIYSDSNGNGQFDGFEAWTVSRGDDPNTAANELGEYQLMGLPPGLHVIRQVVPRGMDQTYPLSAFPEPTPPLLVPVPSDAHVVLLHEGQVVSGFDFGNREFVAGAVAGVKWEDLDGDGNRDDNEPGLANVWIYADINRNARWDRSEPWTRTHADDPVTPEDEAGRYRLDGLRPGEYFIREIVPDGFQQTFPTGNVQDLQNPDFQPWEPIDPNFATVDPQSIELQLAAGETYIATVSITVHVTFIQPITINVSASSPEVQFENLSGPQVNGGGGDTSRFEVMLTGDGTDEFFHIIFFDANPAALSPIYGAIPVTIRAQGSGGAHQVVVEPGQTVERVNFGNQRVRPGSVHGIKWHDRNGDGQRDVDEPGLGGVVIYSDLNRNGMPDENEPHTRSMEDDPATDFDETGLYRLMGLRAGRHVIREVVPDGYQQTYPGPLIVPVEPANPIGSLPHFIPGAHEVNVAPGGAVGNIDFGNQRLVPAAVEGLKWDDLDGDGHRDENEPGLAGVVIYSDLNGNAQFDEGEPHTRTIDDPRDVVPNDTGRYRLENLPPGFHAIREVVPDGYRQTFPNFVYPAGTDPAVAIYPFPEGAHFVVLASGQTLPDIDFGNQSLRPGIVSGYKWSDLNGDRQRNEDEPGLAGVTIFADLNFNGVFDDGEPYTVTASDNPDTNADELGQYHLELEPGFHNIREVVPAGYVQTFPVSPSAAPWPFESIGWHAVTVRPGEVITGLHFGNQPFEPGTVRGVKWNDENGDGTRQDEEPGLAGVTIYSDLNRNNRLDPGEPRVVTNDDDPRTDVDEAGTYNLAGLRQAVHFIREVVPDGYAQTFPPNPVAGETGPYYDGYHVVAIRTPGEVVEGIDFGNQRIVPATVAGRKWHDRDGDGSPDGDERGLAGIVIYSDRNFNGRLDPDEPRTRTRQDDPTTRFDETGLYELNGLRPGRHMIREVVPDGHVQTYPGSDATIPQPGPSGHLVALANGDRVEGLDFGNQTVEPSGVSGRKWVDLDGNGRRDGNEPGLGGVLIYSDRNFNGMFEPGEPSTVTRHDNPATDFDEAGLYVLGDLVPGAHWIREVVPAGSIQTYPRSPLTVVGADSHMIRLSPGEHLDGLDFGNRPRHNIGSLPADFNRDGAVDDADRLLWRQTFGSTTNLAADANGDGVVNAADHVIWRNQRANAAATELKTAAMPAPASVVMSEDAEVADVNQAALLTNPVAKDLGQSQRGVWSASKRQRFGGDVPAPSSDGQLRRLDHLRERLLDAVRSRDAAFDTLADDGNDVAASAKSRIPLTYGDVAAAWDIWP